MSASVTRQQRRQMRRLADAVEQAEDSDRRFFIRFPHRGYRVRVAAPAERKSFEIMQKAPFRLAPDEALFVARKQIARGMRMKVAIVGPRDSIGTELSEDLAGAIYERHVDQYPEIRDYERQVLAGLAGSGERPSDEGTSGT